MVEVSGLSYVYNPKTVLRFPDFQVSNGEHCLLLGESGSGKTTLLHLLGGLLRGYAGKIRVNNTELAFLSESALDKFRGRNIGFVFQKNHLIHALNVEQNLILSPYLAGMTPNPARISYVLESLGITEKKKAPVTTLSHGQAQRVAIARAVLNKPVIILADEPTSALDDKNCERVISLLLEAARESEATLIIATHDQRLKDKVHKQVKL